MNNSVNLEDYRFPVIERPVFVDNGDTSFIDMENPYTYLEGPFKAIVREDTNQLIHIVSKGYKVVPNSLVIDNLLDQLSMIDSPYYIDPSHSFVDNSRMRLQVTFPEITIDDGDSAIPLSLYIHNSYNMSEGVRLFWGAIRAFCSNGMIFGKVLGKFYHRHTKGFNMDKLSHSYNNTIMQLPQVKQRIKELQTQSYDIRDFANLRKAVGKKMAEEALKTPVDTQWQLMNRLTYMISHAVAQRHRARYQMAVSRYFNL